MHRYKIVRHSTKPGFVTVGLDDVFFEESALVLANRIVHKAQYLKDDYVILLEGIEIHSHHTERSGLLGTSINPLDTSNAPRST